MNQDFINAVTEVYHKYNYIPSETHEDWILNSYEFTCGPDSISAEDLAREIEEALKEKEHNVS